MNELRVFLCYRQEDGTDTARWLHKTLDGAELQIYRQVSPQPQILRTYFDVASPAVSDWQQFHGKALASSRALIVICTPGAAMHQGPDDWVHKEIDWWLENRSAAPILIDATTQGERWVPKQIQLRWPKAQRVKLDLRHLSELPDSERQDWFEMTAKRILEGIERSEEVVYLEDAARDSAIMFSERAERAVADGEDFVATLLFMYAAALDETENIRDRYFAHIHFRSGAFREAEPYIQRLLSSQHEEAQHYLQLPALIDRLVRVSTSRAALDSWLLLTAATAPSAYA